MENLNLLTFGKLYQKVLILEIFFSGFTKNECITFLISLSKSARKFLFDN